MECQYKKNGVCELISKLAKKEVIPHVSACYACGKEILSRDINRVVISVALSSLNEEKDKERKYELINKYKDILNYSSDRRLINIMNGTGPGSQLWKILESIGIKHDNDCTCIEWAERMNAWGPFICRENKKEIVEHMKNSAKNYGWIDILTAIKKSIQNKIVFKLSILKPYDSLIDEAIRLSELIYSESIDIVIPLGSGSVNNDVEIRIALRSIEKNAIGYRKIYIIGCTPSFLLNNERICLIPLKEFKCNKEARISEKIRWAFNNLDVTQKIAFWNDDYVLLKKIDIRTIPNYHKGNLYRKKNKGYQKILNNTRNYLILNKHGDLNFDCHVPIIYDRNNFLSIKEQWDDSVKGSGFCAKSLYGNNFCSDDNIRIKDIKLGSNWNKKINKIIRQKRWIISYSDNALKNGFAEWLLKTFPNKSSFEK